MKDQSIATKIERAYLSFPEVMERWGCSENDLRYLLIEGLIKPSHLISDDVRLDDDLEYPRGFYYLLNPFQTKPFDGEFRSFAKEKIDSSFTLDKPIPLSQVLSECVLLWSEILLYEEGVTGPSPDEGNTINPKVRDSLLKMVIAMAMDGYGYRPGAARNQAMGAISDAMNQCGIDIQDDTLRKWLYVAAEKFVPPNSEYRVT